MKFEKINTYNIDNTTHSFDHRPSVKNTEVEHWTYNGSYHREDGPATVWDDGQKEWWLNGKIHRIDGPARIWPDGFNDWYINADYCGTGVEPPEKYLKRLKDIGIKFVRGSDEV